MWPSAFSIILRWIWNIRVMLFNYLSQCGEFSLNYFSNKKPKVSAEISVKTENIFPLQSKEKSSYSVSFCPEYCSIDRLTQTQTKAQQRLFSVHSIKMGVSLHFAVKPKDFIGEKIIHGGEKASKSLHRSKSKRWRKNG